MDARAIARILGVLFVVVGAIAFIPLPLIAPAPALDAPVVSLDAAYRLLFGLFPVNAAHDLVHIILGVWGLAAGVRFRSAVLYCRVVAIVYLVLAIFGLIPLLNTLLGVAPIYGWDVALHFIAALFAAYGGFGRGSQLPGEMNQAASGV
jgi:hypothetical protein